MDARLVTFGHGTAPRERIAELLRGADVRALVDVRTAPGSRRDPEVARGRLSEWLPESGVAYRWEPDLGGFRKPPADSPDVVWRNTSFRGYAAHTRTPAFVAAMDRLLGEVEAGSGDRSGDGRAGGAGSGGGRTAVMCGETVWWRCHRRLIADFAVLARGVPTAHLMHDGRLTPHTPTPGVRLRDDGLLVYDDTAAADRKAATRTAPRRTASTQTASTRTAPTRRAPTR
ncbi:DUF488 domain-containing protein [Streptomyces fradiae]|uniref:DUF488 domain-containing protein n=1 Tax=Streptomyces fradiae TaxID=1906 RepID=UPI003652400E